MPLKPLTIPFPQKGLHEGFSLYDQPRGQFDPATGNTRGTTTPRCQNVRAYDPKTGRNRGASRAGTTKYCTARVDGESAGQDLNYVVGIAELEGLIDEEGNDVITEDNVLAEIEYASNSESGAREIHLVACAGGSLAKVTSSTTMTAVSGGTVALSSALPTIFSTAHGLNLYYADGSNYKTYSSASNTLTDWVATSGTLPEDNSGNRATLIETWRDRIVMAGLLGDAQNWFMSAVGDSLDWEYAPTSTSATMAVAGNNSPAGKIGDIITAIIPYSDDVLIFGGDHTIHRMSGDPADGGTRELISDTVGVAWGRAWCKSPEGILYFFGSRGGVYRLDPAGGVPNRLTAGTIDERLADINMADNIVRLTWDDREIGVLIRITPIDGSATTHYFWDVRNEAWWVDVYDNNDHNPLCTLLYDGDDPDDRSVLEYGQDGYIRKRDIDAGSDDGTTIRSEVWCGPFRDMMIAEMRPTLATTSANLTWTIHTADTLEDALETQPAATGTFLGGKGRSVWPRRHIRSGYVRLKGTGQWAMDRIEANVEQDSETRKRIY